MKIKLSTALDVRDGYGYLGQELAIALSDIGCEVWVDPIKTWYSEEYLKPKLRGLFRPLGSIDFELVIFYPTGQRKIRTHRDSAIMTMYEASKCPTVWTRALNKLGIPIFAPSMFVKEMFKNSGISVPIYHTPLGINTQTYKYVERSENPEIFRFLSMGKMEPRKNTDVTVQAFQEAFDTDDINLVIKTRSGFIPKDIAGKDKRIKVIDKTIPEEQLAMLMNECHCFVYPSRGEGFSFPPRNAIATGMPTIVTDWSALSEIEGAIKVRPESFSPMYPCGFSYGEEKELLMADISPTKLAEHMREVYDNYPSYVNKEHRVFTFHQSAESMVKTIENILEIKYTERVVSG